VLYEMLAGSRPFVGGSAAAVFHSIRAASPESLAHRRSEVPAELSRIVSRMLVPDPGERYSTAAEAFVDLDRLRSGLATGAIPRAARDRVRLLGVAALLLLVVVGAWLWQRGGSAQLPIQATFNRLTDEEGRESFPSLSPDGAWVVYAKTVGGRSHLFLRQVGEGNPRDLSAASPGDDTQPAFSPEGRRIAFRSERDGGGIFVMGSAGGAVRRLTRFGYNPAWSPDGREIALATEGVEDPGFRQTNSDLWRVEVATGERRLVVGGADAVQPSWSPHGRRIAFWGLPPGSADRVLWTVPARGGGGTPARPARVTNDSHLNWNPVWSPDGSYLYFGSDRGGSMNLWRLPVDEETGKARGDAEPITTPSQWSGFWSLSSDGRRMAYSTDDTRANLEQLPFDPRRGEAAGPAVELTRGAQAVASAELSPDGRSIVFDNSVPQEDLFVMNAASGKIRQLTNDRFKDRRPTWSPDGKRLLFYSNRSGRYEAWTIGSGGGGLRQETNTSGGSLTRPIWSPDGRRLACSIGSRGPALFDLTEPIEQRKARFLPPMEQGWTFSPSSWSPDGQRLAGSMSTLDGRGLGFYSLASGRYERLIDGGSEPVWLRDSRTLLYLDKGGIFSLDTSTRESRRILPPSPDVAILSLSVSRDNRSLYLVRARYEGNVWMLKLAGH
jgi:Tol biopolymer transport system component